MPDPLTPEALHARARDTVTGWFHEQFPYSSLNPHVDGDYKKLVKHIAAAFTDLVAEARREVPPCGTCGGVAPESGLPCVCGGRNTIYAEVAGLRDDVFESNAREEKLANFRAFWWAI